MSARQYWLAFAASVAVVVFTARGSDANAPTGHYIVSNGTVYDTKSKLTWQQTAPVATYTQAAASSYCSTLSINGIGSWRLPSFKEYFSLFDVSQTSDPYIDRSAFGSVAGQTFWTLTPIAGASPPEAYTSDGAGNAVTTSWNVRCVH